ncbi:MAG: TonB-dependent receptor [Ignavibacteriae bacterium]|nr:TonB-dependent receptor [Ignavibacteriota bacterium]
MRIDFRLTIKNYISLFILFILFSSVMYAGTTGKLSGKIVDKETGESVIGANILLEGTFFGAAADIEGDYYINNIPPGKYTVVVSAVGYHKTRIENVAVRIDLTTKVDVSLVSESIKIDEIVVQAEAPLITKDLTSTSAIVTSDDIKMMPVENIGQIINLQAGVVDGHFRGGRSNEVAYLVDGVPVNDVYNGANALQVENNSVRELEVISGTFNAEYGKALSGVVNIVTKDGSSFYEGFASAYLGSYFTNHTGIFYNLNKVDFSGPKDLQFSLSGPTKLLDGLTFFMTGRYFKSDGYIYGKRVYNTNDFSPIIFDESDPTAFYVFHTGNGKYVPMNPEDNKSFNGKLTYGLANWKFSYSFFWDDHWNKYYSHDYRLAPDGLKNHYRTNTSNNIQISFYPSQDVFASLKLASNFNRYNGYLYEDEFDTNYVDPTLSTTKSSYTFRHGGNETDRYNRFTYTNTAIFSLESQVTKQHKVKLGTEFTQYKLFYHWKDIRNQTEGILDTITNQPIYTIGYTNVGTEYNEKYQRRPFEFSAYIQDKMEYDIMIINAGVRVDYFNSNDSLPIDLQNPRNNPLFFEKTLEKYGKLGYVSSEPEFQVSPRLGVSFPISDQGAIHFSYGHFFQIPTFDVLYTNGAYVIVEGALSSIIGNPNLKAQKTVKYELGVQQVVFPNISVDASIYYSDINNLLGTEVIKTYDGDLYGRYFNRDYGNVRGLVLTLDKRYADMFSAKIDYTYQVAQGNASDPLTNFYNQQTQPPKESNKKVVPLNWDQNHTLNASITIGDAKDWTVGLIFNYGSGMPYTEDARFTQNLRFENNGRKPTVLNLDLKATKTLEIYGLFFNTYLLVYNLFDIKNEYGVSASTGRAGVDLGAEQYTGVIYGLNTIKEYLLNPNDYSAPRQVRIGFSVGF